MICCSWQERTILSWGYCWALYNLLTSLRRHIQPMNRSIKCGKTGWDKHHDQFKQSEGLNFLRPILTNICPHWKDHVGLSITISVNRAKGRISVLGPILTHICPHWIQEYGKLSQAVVKGGMKTFSGSYIAYLCSIDWVHGHYSDFYSVQELKLLFQT